MVGEPPADDDLTPAQTAALRAAVWGLLTPEFKALPETPGFKALSAVTRARLKVHLETAAAAADWVMSLPKAQRRQLLVVPPERCPQCDAVLLSIYKIPASRPETRPLGWLGLVVPAARAVYPARPNWDRPPLRCHRHG